MQILKLATGLALLLLGAAFLYRPAVILSINAYLREFLANDRRVILYHRKIAIFLVSLSFIALYMGMPVVKKSASGRRDAFQPAAAGAIKDYYTGNYRESLRKTLRILADNPDEEWALVHLGMVYEMLGENERARQVFAKASSKYPRNRTASKKLELLPK